MATVTTSEFVKAREYVASFSMIEQKGIVARLVEESSLAVSDFTRDPRGFIREIFSDEAKDAQRSKRIRAGLALGLAFQVVVITAIAIAGWRHATAITQSEKPEYEVKWVDPKPPKSTTENLKDSPTNGDSPSNTSKPPKGNVDAGSSSGGSGNNNPLPPTKGVIPRLPNPAVIPLTTPSSPNPALPVPVGIEGLPTPPPPTNAQIGVSTGTPNTNSPGPGIGGNIGTGKGTGAGDNTGPGGGNNPNGGTGGGEKVGTPGSPNGSITPTGAIDYAPFSRMPDTTGIIWIRRVKPIITPEAQADKVHGYVLLEATFNADGTITDIIVRQPLHSMNDDSMNEAAKEALQKAKFRPATIKGVPVTLRRVLIRVNVNLN